jgi:hypothetical protein
MGCKETLAAAPGRHYVPVTELKYPLRSSLSRLAVGYEAQMGVTKEEPVPWPIVLNLKVPMAQLRPR